jgi:2-deoxy-D-gluconate 3-dehydrogenase
VFDLTGKTALVTGCSRGLGRAMAVALAEAGADVVGVSATLDRSASEVGADIESLGRSFRPYACDFGDRDALYAFIDALRRDVPVVDILVNNAGTILRGPAIDHPDDFWDRVLEVDLTSQFVLTREVAKGMLERGSGKVIFVASLLTFQGGVNVPGYAAAKGGVGQLTKALANEWAAHGVNVNAIAPGYMRTDNTQPLRDDEMRSRQIVERIPAGRWGEPEDLKGAVVFLASPASDYVHGSILTVDGGWMGR